MTMSVYTVFVTAKTINKYYLDSVVRYLIFWMFACFNSKVVYNDTCCEMKNHLGRCFECISMSNWCNGRADGLGHTSLVLRDDYTECQMFA